MPYWLFICGGLALITTIIWAIRKKSGWFLMAFPVVLVLVTLVWFVPMSVMNPEYNVRATSTTEIYSLRTTELVSGNFTLGCGQINNETYYIYYTQNGDGSYSINKVEAEDCKIFMDRQSGGTLVRVYKQIDNLELSEHWGFEKEKYVGTELHLPYGSLIQDYSVR